MRAARWLAFGVGAALGVLGGCFFPVQLTGPYHCDEGDQCPGDAGLSCVNGLCCKEDGGSPRCPRRDEPDGGTCTLPSDLNCLTSRLGICTAGTWSCARGGDMPTCEQNVPSGTESCNGLDDDCDGITDPFPRCGGPESFLQPDAAYVLGAVRVYGSWPFTTTCLKGAPGDATEVYDGTRWSALGVPGPGDGGREYRTHVLYAEAADGGSWDLSEPGQELQLQFGGLLYNAAIGQPFAGYQQPLVLLCSRGGGMKRLSPVGQVLSIAPGQFSLTTAINLRNPGSPWTGNETSLPAFRLDAVQRVEVTLELFAKASGPAAGFDAGFAVFGFSSP